MAQRIDRPTQMNFILLLCCAAVALSAAAHITDNGQPGCQTEDELNVRTYRDNWDPTAYWLCETRGAAAKMQRCRSGQAYLQSVRDCVPWSQWRWEAPVAPPSRPVDNEEEEQPPAVPAAVAEDGE